MRSIKKTIITNTAMVVLILAAAVVTILAVTTRTITNSILLNTMPPLARTASQTIEGNLHVLADRIFLISDNTAFTQPNTSNEEKQAILDKAVSGIEFMALSLYDAQGGYLLGNGEAPSDISGEEFYQLMESTGGLVIDDTQVVNGNLQISIGTPILEENGTIAGYLVGNYKYDVLNDVMSNIHLGYTGHAFVFNEEGQIMAHPNKQKVLEKQNVYTLYEGNEKASQLFDRVIAGEIGASYLKIDGKNQYAAYAPVRGTNWSIVVLVPRADFIGAGNQAIILTLALVAVLLMFASVLIARFSGKIAHSMGNVTRRLEQLAQGDLSSPVEIIPTGDETEVLATALNQTIEDINAYLGELKDSLYSLSKGDLNVEVSGSFSGDFVVMKDSLNSIIDFLNDVMRELQAAAEQMQIASHRVSSNAQTVNSSSESQSHSVARLEQESETISQNIAAVNSNTKRAEELMELVNGQLVRGDEQMKKMLLSVDSINQNAKEISKISKFMEDIAFQTNILALNASVEAARAGVAGKGFSVVAQEVRNLAEKSAESSKRATEMLEFSQQQVSEGYVFAHETAKTMEEISNISKEISTIIDELVVSVQTQKGALEGIVQDIREVSDLGAQNLGASEQSAQASYELTQQAEALKNIVGRFNLRTAKLHVFAMNEEGEV